MKKNNKLYFKRSACYVHSNIVKYKPGQREGCCLQYG